MPIAGEKIGPYVLLRIIGKGGFGEVWLAEKKSELITKKVAVKLPLEDQINIEAIRQEANLWEQASGHPNVLPIIDAEIYEGQIVIVSEYADGGSLHDAIKRHGKMPADQAIEMISGVLSGLEFLHNKQIIHRDIKPQNILLQGNTPRLADFGISRAMQTTSASSTIVGTSAYMAPEAFDGQRSFQTDIWAVGVMLYQLLEGRLPFPQENPSERMFAIIQKDFAPLSDGIPESLRNIIAKALAKLPENRYEKAGLMKNDLRKAALGQNVEIPVFIAPPKSAIPPVGEIEFETEAVTRVSRKAPPEIKSIAPEPSLQDALAGNTLLKWIYAIIGLFGGGLLLGGIALFSFDGSSYLVSNSGIPAAANQSSNIDSNPEANSNNLSANANKTPSKTPTPNEEPKPKPTPKPETNTSQNPEPAKDGKPEPPPASQTPIIIGQSPSPTPEKTPDPPSGPVSGGVVNGKATSLPKPPYPAAAKAIRASGRVMVQVLIDEDGKVISANASSGHVLLRRAAEQAASNAKFSPTILSGRKVKVSGVIVYNFTL